MSPFAHPAHRPDEAIEYPDSDGLPMADNTEQFDFIQVFQGNLDALVPDFVAGDHLWYPILGHPEICTAPDVYVALGRPKGHRGSYKQWEEEGIPPRVVLEWWSPDNNFAHQAKKLLFYDRHGVEEFYTFDQRRREFSAFIRQQGQLDPVSTDGGFTSPLLGVRFEVVDGELKGYYPDGRPFLSIKELKNALSRSEEERQKAEEERQKAEEERQKAEEERQKAEARAAALADRLRALGIDPDAP